MIRGVEVAVGKGVQEEVRAGPASGERAVIVGDVVGVEEFSCVVCVVAGILEEDGKIVVIKALIYELGVSAWVMSTSFVQVYF